MPIRIVIADDHAIFREGLAALLGQQMDIEIVGMASDGAETIQMCNRVPVDVVVMDLAMPVLGGLEATAILRRDCPETHVVALTIHTESAFVCRALDAGVSGYILKSSAIEELSAAIRSAARGEVYLDHAAQAALVSERSSVSGQGHGGAHLTAREQEVLALLAKGYSATQVSSKLHLSRKTVEAYRRKLKLKIGVESTAELVLYALREGYVSLD